MKKTLFYSIITCVFILLIACTPKQKEDIIVFPKTTWRMSPDEVLDAYQLTKSHVQWDENEDITHISIPKFQLFGVTTEGVVFEFLKDKKGNFRLYNVMVSYSKNQNMNEVLKQLEKEYGLPVKSYSNYTRDLDEKKMKKKDMESTDHKKYFLSKKTLKNQLTKQQKKDLHDILGKSFYNSKDWEEFLTVTPVSMLTWTDDYSLPGFLAEKAEGSKNKVFYHGTGFYAIDKYIQ